MTGHAFKSDLTAMTYKGENINLETGNFLSQPFTSVWKTEENMGSC